MVRAVLLSAPPLQPIFERSKSVADAHDLFVLDHRHRSFGLQLQLDLTRGTVRDIKVEYSRVSASGVRTQFAHEVAALRQLLAARQTTAFVRWLVHQRHCCAWSVALRVDVRFVLAAFEQDYAAVAAADAALDSVLGRATRELDGLCVAYYAPRGAAPDDAATERRLHVRMERVRGATHHRFPYESQRVADAGAPHDVASAQALWHSAPQGELSEPAPLRFVACLSHALPVTPAMFAELLVEGGVDAAATTPLLNASGILPTMLQLIYEQCFGVLPDDDRRTSTIWTVHGTLGRIVLRACALLTCVASGQSLSAV